MRKDAYDIVFDGLQFVAWHMAHLQHVPLIKLPGRLSFAVIVKKDEQHIKTIAQAAPYAGSRRPTWQRLPHNMNFPIRICRVSFCS